MEPTLLTAHVLDDEHCIMTLPDVLSAAECASLIVFAERRGFEEAPITTFQGPIMAPEVRNNTRVMIDDPARAATLWAKIAPALPARQRTWRAVGLNERFRFYRYEAGQCFRWHRDGAFERSNGERSRLTLMFYLNDDFEGGATEFEGGLAVQPRRGSALVFVHPVRHQGASVVRGRKYVLRTDVMYAREG